MLRRFLIFLFLLLSACFAAAQDVHVDCSNANPCILTPSGGTAWASANQAWIFPTISRSVNIYVQIHNQNPTNSHTLTLSIFQTSFPQNVAPTLTANADLWAQDAVTQNTVAGASCNSVNTAVPGTPGASGTGVCYAIGIQAQQVAIRITGAAAAGGSPDSFDLSIIQIPSGYSGGPQPGSDSSTGAVDKGSGIVTSNTPRVTIAGITPADQTSNTTIPGIEIYPMLFNFALANTWTRLRSASDVYSGNQATMTVGTQATLPVRGRELSTYSAAVGASTPVATPTDLMEICGNSTTTVQITKWVASFTATAAPGSAIVLSWTRHSAADTGSTPVSLTVASNDLNDAAASTTPRAFTVTNPTPGAIVVTMKQDFITPDNVLSNTNPQFIYSYTQTPGAKPWTLRGASQCIVINLNAPTLPTGFSYTSAIEWIERTDI